MQRFHDERSTPAYISGNWKWNDNTEALDFQVYTDLEEKPERFIYTNGFQFIRTITQDEESVFRMMFLRSETSFDADTVIIEDVRNLVLFLMPKEFVTASFIEFMHQPVVLNLLNGLIIYFEYFLRFVELVLIQRDESVGNNRKMQTMQSVKMKRIWSTYLSQHRLLVARDYTELILGSGELHKYHHLNHPLNISATARDCTMYEQFLAVATHIVWITMHRRAYYVIEMEINRLFRSEHFLKKRPEYPRFSPVERSLLYGRNNKLVSYKWQTSPLMQELQNICQADMPLLFIGRRKYIGTDARIAELELEYIVPGAQLRLIDVQHGILGHPKTAYDTLLRLNWSSVRHSTDAWIVSKQPYLRIPNIKKIKELKSTERLDYRYNILMHYEPAPREMLVKWMKREEIIKNYMHYEKIENASDMCKKISISEKDWRAAHKVVSSYIGIISKLRKSRK